LILLKLVFKRNDLNIILKDFKQVYQERDLWINLAWIEMKRKYNGTKFGFLWQIISTLTIGLCLGSFYSIILKQTPSFYIPYLITGLVVWNLISQFITEGCRVFLIHSRQIKEVPINYFSYVFKLLLKNIFIFGFGLLSTSMVLVYFGKIADINFFMMLFGILIVTINGFWFSILFGMLTLFFRDITEIISNFIRLVFFVTPVLWVPELAGSRAYLVHLNPLFYYLDVIRSPILGQDLNQLTLLITTTLGFLGLIVSFFVYYKNKNKIPYMV
jgi:ABC-type polysaccharide/polyol phosphate export permease